VKTNIDFDAAARKVNATARLLGAVVASGRILVVGCGDGREAGQIARLLRADVTGIDVGGEFEFDHAVAKPATLINMDAQQLAFPPDSFDAVYSFHSLEHIPDPRLALAEMRRVLRPGGAWLIGTPNKRRAIGYIGSASPVRDRIRWNLNDWRYRATGRWSNEMGAHAGFTASELLEMCNHALGRASDVSDAYYRTLYSQKQRLINFLVRTGLRRWAYPAIYVSSCEPETIA
jgi:ubiquinone/menaquinone biosynthesis C-methylase UbiE